VELSSLILKPTCPTAFEIVPFSLIEMAVRKWLVQGVSDPASFFELWRTAKAEACVVVAFRWRVVVAIGNTAVDRVVVPTATAYHAIRALAIF